MSKQAYLRGFIYLNFLSTEEIPRVSSCSISMCYGKLHSFALPPCTFTNGTHHAMYRMLNHPHSLRIPIRAAYFLDLLLYGTTSRQEVFTIKIIFTYSSMDLNAIFPAKPHEPHFFSFLTPIHHTLISSGTHTSDLLLKMVENLIVSPP